MALMGLRARTEIEIVFILDEKLTVRVRLYGHKRGVESINQAWRSYCIVQTHIFCSSRN